MSKEIIFFIVLLLAIGIFSWTCFRIYRFFRLTKPAFKVRNIGKRIGVMLSVAFGQTRIMRKPVIGFMHAMVFWGFCIILIGSIEMVIDGLTGSERVLSILGPVYDIIIGAGDIFALFIAIFIVVFLVRRLFHAVKRFDGIEMKPKSHKDANIALSMILLLMLTLLGMNTFYLLSTENPVGTFPVSELLVPWFSGISPYHQHLWHEINWWGHIVLIMIFANILPYSKHFHVFMSVPNVFLSRLYPLGYLPNMETITKEVKMMMNPDTAYAAPAEGAIEEEVTRFGIKDVEDVTWKNYLDALSCTECGRCTEVCPANKTGKKLSPRKIFIDLRARMKEKGPQLIKDKSFDDQKSLLRDCISTEELWACTTCNACARECPVSINHPIMIMDMRRYLVMEEAAAPAEINAIFTNIENNGAPWQFSPEDRMLWADNITDNQNNPVIIPTMAECVAQGKQPEYLLWVGSAGAFDDRYRKVMRAFVTLLSHASVDYAVLGTEESDSGDIARRCGNEMLYQMQAMMNIELLKKYQVENIIVCDPHDYNTLKNEYPDYGGSFNVIHYTYLLNDLINTNKLNLNKIPVNKTITYHDPCYLGRANGEYDTPRAVLQNIGYTITEMPHNRSFALCCGAGGGQMFKEAEKGDKEVFIERTEEALSINPDIIASACPFCMTMLTDGLKYKNCEEKIFNKDIAELVLEKLV